MAPIARLRFGRRAGQFTRKRTVENADMWHEIGVRNKNRRVSTDIPVPAANGDPVPPVDITPTRRGITELKQLGKELWCYACDSPLSLRHIESESVKGVVRNVNVRCHKCQHVLNVDTCKRTVTSRIYDVNTKLALGAVDGGMGCQTVNTLFSAMNMPTVTSALFKRHERIVGPALEEVANESCVANIRMEKELTIGAEGCDHKQSRSQAFSV